MSRFTCLTNLELFLVQETFVEQLELVSQICATVTSPFIETLDICLRWDKENSLIPEVFASLEKLRAIDTVLSRTQFSHLSKITFDFLSYISWKNNLRRLVVSWAHLRIESPLSPVTLQFVPVLMNSSQAMRTFFTSGAQPGYPMLSWRISYGVKPNWSWEISTIVEYVKQK